MKSLWCVFLLGLLGLFTVPAFGRLLDGRYVRQENALVSPNFLPERFSLKHVGPDLGNRQRREIHFEVQGIEATTRRFSMGCTTSRSGMAAS
jgi:hypothetical protein